MKAVKQAICGAKLQSVRWWMTTYFPDHEFAVLEIQKLAIEEECDYHTKRRVEILHWLLDQGELANRDSIFRVRSGWPKVLLEWLHEHAPNIRLIIGVGYNSSRAFLTWVCDRRDRYEVDSLVGYIYKSVHEGYGTRDFPWLHELCDIRLPCTLLNDFLYRIYVVDEIKWLYDYNPKQYFDDPSQPSIRLKVIHWFLTEYEWKDNNARIKWIQMCMESAARRADSLENIKFLFKIRPETGTGKAMSIAARMVTFTL